MAALLCRQSPGAATSQQNWCKSVVGLPGCKKHERTELSNNYKQTDANEENVTALQGETSIFGELIE